MGAYKEKVCEVCSKIYKPNYKAQRSCGRECSRSLKRKPHGEPRLGTCEYCGSMFPMSRLGRPRKHCYDCLFLQVECACRCGELIYPNPFNYKFKHGHNVRLDEGQRLPIFYGDDNPSRRPEVRQKLSEMRRGDKNPNWNPNWSSDLYAPYQREFFQAKLKVWERDGSKCRVCGVGYIKKGTDGRKVSNLVVHHIDEDPSNNVPENLILVCRSDHRLIHSGSIVLGGVE